jgi:hypothetical protein
MKKIIFLLVFILNVDFSYAVEKIKEEKVARYIIENIQKDYTSCYAFYKVAAESFKKNKIIDTLAQDKKIIEGLEKSADTTLKYSYDLGEVLGINPKTMTNNNEKELRKISKILSKNDKSLREKMKIKGLFCKKLVEDQQQRIDYWENEGNNKIK